MHKLLSATRAVWRYDGLTSRAFLSCSMKKRNNRQKQLRQKQLIGRNSNPEPIAIETLLHELDSATKRQKTSRKVTAHDVCMLVYQVC